MIIAPASSFQYNPFFVRDGQVSWSHMQGDHYVVTGVDRDGKRFRMTFDNWKNAHGINLWRGSKWLLRSGKRWLITRVRN
jgi:hypothetical protein